MLRFPSGRPYRRFAAAAVLLLLWVASAYGQGNRNLQQQPFPAMGGIPLINVGGDALESQFARLQFAQMMLEDQAKDARRREEGRKQGQKMVDAGLVSALDLAAPGKAVDEFNKAAGLIKEQKSKEAVPHLQKALAAYPKFVSAHNNLGLAYMDLDQPELARAQFQAAAELDKAFPGSFLNLGRLALMQQDYASAQKYVGAAARLAPRDANVLTVLAYAQNGGRAYHEAISTAERVHALEHKGLANVHYVAAAAALELGDTAAAQRELAAFVREDPSNALAPVARQNLEVLAHPTALVPVRSVQPAQNLANSERLREQVAALGDENETAACAECASAPPLPPAHRPPTAARGPSQGRAGLSAAPSTRSRSSSR